jgi:hypothetical protein
MHHLDPVLKSHPSGAKVASALLDCIHACQDCATTCASCADACLAESNVAELAHCIGLNIDCGAVCSTTAEVLARPGNRDEGLAQALLRACEIACRVCAEACEKHADLEHCRICAEACRECERACGQLLGAVAEAK